MKLIAATLAASFVLLLQATPSWACSCLAQSPEEYAEGSAAIFAGVVEELGSSGVAGELRAAIAVDIVYKGDVPGRAIVRTAANSAACGVEFEEGRRYTVFAGGSDAAGFSTNLCSATTSGDIDAAEFGLIPTEVESPAPSDGPSAAPFLLSLAGVMVAGGLVLVLVRRRRARAAATAGIE